MLSWMLSHTVVVCLLAGAAWAVGRSQRVGAAARHVMWLVLLLKFVTPPLLYCSAPWPTWTTASEAKAEADSSARIVQTTTYVIRDVDPRDLLADAVLTAPGASIAAVARSDGGGGEWFGLIVVSTWIFGGMLVFGRSVYGLTRWVPRLRTGEPISAKLADLISEQATALGMRGPRALAIRGLPSPLVWGVGPVRLLWPAGLEDELSDEAVRAVLTHELAHLRRRDHWVGWLLLVGGCVWWWHPVFRLVKRRLSQEAEYACDAWVLRTLPGARRSYAEALIEVLQRLSRSAEPAPALGAAGGRADLERRLLVIMRQETSPRLSRGWRLAATVFLVLALPAWTLGQKSADEPKAQDTSAKPTAQNQQKSSDQATMPNRIIGFAGQAVNKARKDVGSATPAVDRDKRLKEIETQLQTLLQELKSLRADAVKVENTTTQQILATIPYPDAGSVLLAPSSHVSTVYSSALTYLGQADAGAASQSTVVTLTRTTYKLKPASAESLSKLLQEHVKGAVVETKVDGDNLIVTTTPEAQRTIAQFLLLFEGPKDAKTTGKATSSGTSNSGSSSTP